MMSSVNAWKVIIATIRENPLYVYLAVALVLGFLLVIAAVVITMA